MHTTYEFAELHHGPYDGQLYCLTDAGQTQIRILVRVSRQLGEVYAVYVQAGFGHFAFLDYDYAHTRPMSWRERAAELIRRWR